MTNENDYIVVYGNFLMDSFRNHSSILTAGIFEIKGDITRFIPTIKKFIDKCDIKNEFFGFRYFILNNIELFFENIHQQKIILGLINKENND